MVRQTLSLFTFVLLLGFVSAAQEVSEKTWRFAVSGDSRNCGDVVIPGIAKSVLAHNVEFYWHLGDFRIGYDVDEDMRQLDAKLSIDDYHKMAWDDFITHQVESFKTTAVHLGIGNHEMYMHENTPAGQDLSHAEFIVLITSTCLTVNISGFRFRCLKATTRFSDRTWFPIQAKMSFDYLVR